MVCGATAYACKFEYAPLSESDKGFQIMSDKMEALSQDSILLVAKTLWQCGLNLMGYARDSPTVLNGKVYEEHRGDDIRSMSLILYSYSCCPRLLLRYLFGDFSNSSMEIAKSTRLSTKLHFSQLSPIFITLTLFIDGLLCIARARKMKRLTSPHAMRCSNRLRQWADNEPYSYLGKHLILKAELGSLRNNFKKTLRRYVIAVSVSKRSQSFLEYALANELTAKYLIRRGEMSNAREYCRNAVEAYFNWGAICKSNHLQGEFKQYGFKL